MKALVTGGAGFIGSNLTKILCDEGHKIAVLDDLSSGDKLSVDKRAQFVRGSVGDSKLVMKLLKGKDVVFHLAAIGIIQLSLENPTAYFKNNTMNGVTLLEAMRKTGVKKIIYSSSSGAYGEPERVPIKDEDLKNPINPYGAAKLAFENVLSSYYHAFGINSISLRYFNVYGPGDEQRPVTRAVPCWIRAALLDEPLIIYWRGLQRKDYIFVEDVARANLLAALKCEGCSVYNVGSGEGILIKDLAKTLERVFGRKLKIKYRGNRAGDPQVLIANISKIKRELHWRPLVSIEAGLKSTIEYYKNRLS